MAADYSRIHRLLKILTLIQGEQGWTAARLALECGTTQRTVYRDLKMLDAAGIPCFFDEDTKGYSVRRDFFLPPVQLEFDEALALLALAQHIGGAEQVPHTQAAARAISKIRGQLPAKVREELEQIEDHVQMKLAAAMPPESSQDVYQTVRQALAAKRALSCEYESASRDSADGQRFLLHPYTLFFNQRAWYVIGHHSRHNEIRCMKLNRFVRIEPTDVAYAIPKNFTLDKHLGNAWRMIRGKAEHEVELHFDKDFADNISDTAWHTTQDIQWNEDDSITFRCTVAGLDEIVWWVLSMGPHCRVIKPAALAKRVAELAEGVVALYNKPTGGKSKTLAKA